MDSTKSDGTSTDDAKIKSNDDIKLIATGINIY
jgi:hypothetical protein